MSIQNVRVGAKVHSLDEVRVGTVLILRGKDRQPFIVKEITKHSESHSEISYRLDILECGHTSPSHRKVRIENIENSYLWVADAFMNPEYIQFCATVDGKFNPNKEVDKIWRLLNNLVKVVIGEVLVRETIEKEPQYANKNIRWDFRNAREIFEHYIDMLNEALLGLTGSKPPAIPDFGSMKTFGSVLRPKVTMDGQVPCHILTQQEINAMSPEERRFLEMVIQLNKLCKGTGPEFVEEETGKVLSLDNKGPGLNAEDLAKVMTEAGYVKVDVDADGRLKFPQDVSGDTPASNPPQAPC